MAEGPWLTIVGLGEDGPEGLSPASRRALEAAEVVHGAAAAPGAAAGRRGRADRLAGALRRRAAAAQGLAGRRVVVLASGDPFWFGAGAVIARELPDRGRGAPCRVLRRSRWPRRGSAGRSSGRRASASTPRPCAGAAASGAGARILVWCATGGPRPTSRGSLAQAGFGASRVWAMQALGGPRERVVETTAQGFGDNDLAHPVCVAVEVAGDAPALPWAVGRPDELFENDGQITKRPVRALTLSALAPCPGERLWDIGAGSGSVSIEWLLSHPSTEATAVEVRADRAARVRANAAALGADRLDVVTGTAPEALQGLPGPDAVFVGGGLSEEMLAALWQRLPPGTRVVANAVTLESEALLAPLAIPRRR